MMKTALLTASCLAFLWGCAHRQTPPGGVIVDMRGVDPVKYQQDLAECGTYADQVDASGKVVGGAAGGAVVGGAVGAIYGGSEGAAKGAGAGGIIGGARGVRGTQQERQQVMRNCLRGRGYAVLN